MPSTPAHTLSASQHLRGPFPELGPCALPRAQVARPRLSSGEMPSKPKRENPQMRVSVPRKARATKERWGKQEVAGRGWLLPAAPLYSRSAGTPGKAPGMRSSQSASRAAGSLACARGRCPDPREPSRSSGENRVSATREWEGLSQRASLGSHQPLKPGEVKQPATGFGALASLPPSHYVSVS